MKTVTTIFFFLCSFGLFSQCLSGNCENGYGYYQYGNGTYEGYFKNGKENGFGILLFNSGAKYEGEWLNGKKSGKGTFYFADGSVKEGEFVNGVFVKGSVKLSSGDKYIGSEVNGMFNGKGTFTWTNGDKYEGDFLDGELHGNGKLTKANGIVKIGVWSHNQLIENKNANSENVAVGNVKIGDQILNSGKPQQQAGVANPSNDLKDFVKIGSQYWSKKNLSVSTFRNGDVIFEAKTIKEWKDAVNSGIPAWMSLNFDSKNIEKFGRIYNWYAVIDSRGLSPVGTHIPEYSEWRDLILSSGGKEYNRKYILPYAKILMAPPNIEVKKVEITSGGYYDDKYVSCPKCSYWTEEQRRHNPCENCKNTRQVKVSGPYIPKTKKMVDMEFNHGWNGENTNGFNALPCGHHDEPSAGNSYSIKENKAIWWSSTVDSRYESRNKLPFIFILEKDSHNIQGELVNSEYFDTSYDANFRQISSAGFYVRYVKD